MHKMKTKIMRLAAGMTIACMLGAILPKANMVKAASKIAEVETIIIPAMEEVDSTNYNSGGYSANVSPISQFYDKDGNLNIAYDGETSFYITILNSKGEVSQTIPIMKRYSLLGGVAYADGYYYVVYGNENTTDDTSIVVMSVAKYDSNGAYVAEVTYTGDQTCPYSGSEWGTKLPFRSGNCSISIQEGILVCSYARQMYSKHQSNHVLYVDINQMKKLSTAPSYTSHSFDQRVIATQDGSYLFADHGDAYGRGFNITKISASSNDIWSNEELVSFHFREGSNRDYGYNETYAQLGGIAECSTGYVLVGSSEKTLSLEVAPTNKEYCGHSEARNLFLQILKKDFNLYEDSDCYAVSGTTRKATGSKPTNAKTNLFLDENTVDYGVIWLTDYSDEYYCASPKVVVTEDDEIVVLWEKLQYSDDSIIDSYIMILASDGTVIQEATSLGGVRLDSDEDVLYRGGTLVWTTNPSDDMSTSLQVHSLKLGSYVTQKKLKDLTFKSVKTKTYSELGKELDFTIKDGSKILVKNVDYSIYFLKYPYYAGEWKVVVTGMGRYTGSKKLTITVKPSKPVISSIKSKSKGVLKAEINNDCGEEGFQWQYSTSKNFKSNVKKCDDWGYFSQSGLKSGATYYVRSRGYVEVNGKRIYGAYSDVVKVKIK